MLPFPGLPMRRSLVDALVSAFKLATRWQFTFSGSSTRVLCTTTSPPVFPLLVPLFVRTCSVIWKPFGLPLLPPRVSGFSRTGVLRLSLHHAPFLSTFAYNIVNTPHSHREVFTGCVDLRGRCR